ncbi:MAG: hypothetical protein RMJ35_13145, partial [Phycisphaerales bacterium]|nr:hypothetical protein [Phycisphaerales bacterium]
MIGYLIRRILLFVPTMIGATAIIFLLMAYAPIKIVDVLLPPGGEILPGQRAEREAYIEERYGLDKPGYIQYLRWLNNISPIGFHTWQRDDPPVREALARRQEYFKRIEPVVRAENPGLSDREVRRKMREMARAEGIGPLPGDLRWDKFPIKRPNLGDSFIQSRPVEPIIRQALPVTIILQAI